MSDNLLPFMGMGKDVLVVVDKNDKLEFFIFAPSALNYILVFPVEIRFREVGGTFFYFYPFGGPGLLLFLIEDTINVGHGSKLIIIVFPRYI